MELVKDGQGKRVSFTSDHHAIGPQDSCGTRERYDLHSSGHRHQASFGSVRRITQLENGGMSRTGRTKKGKWGQVGAARQWRQVHFLP
jgi:hypothetical protein